MNGANAAAIEMADTGVLVATPDVITVRAAKRMVRLWERLQIRKAEETVTVVNRYTRNTEIQPPLVERITGTRVARTTVPSHFKELQSVVDAGRIQDLEAKSVVKQAIWALAGELGLVKPAAGERGDGDAATGTGDRSACAGHGRDDGDVNGRGRGRAPERAGMSVDGDVGSGTEGNGGPWKWRRYGGGTGSTTTAASSASSSRAPSR